MAAHPAAGLLIVFLLLLLLAGRAYGSYEQVGTFGGTLVAPVSPEPFPEKAQLGSASGMAVNVTGVGGVPPGTVYVATQDPDHLQGPVKVLRFDPDGTFRMAWTTTSERCGTPEGLPACPPHPSAGRAAVDVEINPTTGDVYTFNGEKTSSGAKEIQVFNALGTELITEFGERITGKKTAESLDKLHGSSGTPGGIAVDSSGDVYVFDFNSPDSFRYRLMKFEPQTPGVFTSYVYAGEEHDVDPGTIKAGEEAMIPSRPVLDAAGFIYVAGEAYIQKLDPSEPTAEALCTFNVKDAGVRGMNVNPQTGEVFFYDYKDRKVHQLAPCSAGAFTEIATVSPTPKRGYAEALAVNPTLEWASTHPAGVLYAATPEQVGEAGGGEISQSALGYIFAQAEPREPVIESESVSQVGFSTATLKAMVNPKGAETTYVFEYLTDAAYEANEPANRFAGASEAPAGGGNLGNGVEPALAVGELSGLQPGTLYHFRVVATSVEGTATGEAQTFATFAFNGLTLLDHRAYELVSPVEKSGGEVFPANPTAGSCHGVCKPGAGRAALPMQASPSGDSVAYEGSSFSFGGGAVLENEYLSSRTPSGWQTTALNSTLQSSGDGTGSNAFNAELTLGVISQGLPTLAAGAPDEYPNLYRQSTGTPAALTPLLLQPPFNRPPGASLNLIYAGASADFSRIYFEANDALTEATPVAPAAEDGGTGKMNLYEWQGGQLRLVNVKPGNTEAPAGAAFGRPKNETGTVKAALVHAISADGSRIFWSLAGQVYVRENAEITREVPDAGEFLGAADDGSSVLLTNGHVYDLEINMPTDLTGGAGGFVGLVGSSEDLDSIYFVDTAVLDATENDFGAEAQAGQNNLYVWREGTVSYIATLSPKDGSDTKGDWSFSPIQRTAKASPNGRWLAFQSESALTGYDNTGPCKVISGTEEVVDGPCVEVFLFDSESGKLTCASCRPSGERPLGPSSLTRRASADGSLQPPSYLTDSGRLYFDSRDSLSPLDTNEGVEDVYQFEPPGIGTCEQEAGCVSLISAGRGPVDSNFAAVDPSGNNVFFTTRDQLVVSDKDELIDLYDARVDGGFPTPSPVGECQGDGCQPVIPAPAETAPSSSSFTGAGNLKPTKRCKKGQVKKKGHCVKKHPRRKHSKGKHRRRASTKSRGGTK